ncbi:DUF4878 domain-containing protein [Paenibacillus sp. MMS20-IR301]|uniref:DUF4878 domain-containing protein n=1 Tax=Paenibacillus sp. MMS20-IR301 TaxID=2895946 RepID=UPI0028ECD29B|nr:DUF4878 domain-containing protein [Paenibacillus sp. MMS20-IR301]WNS41718.1 hypothetical protein LOS79_22225 [Paenibacillus sp. MMS20-IR301]
MNHFNDIYKWSVYASDEYIARVYMWCSGDTSESKSIDEMKQQYAEISKERASLTDYEIKQMSKINTDEYEVEVHHSWDNGGEDSTIYSAVKVDGVWKVNDRI